MKLKNDTFVHRDFHVSNLMYFKNKLAFIDTQDAVIGNQAYDLVSLVDDVRYKTSKNFKKKIYNFYFKKNKKNINENFFLNDFEILSVLRNLKIIGIFTRLAKRDNKKLYLKLIPYTWRLIDLRCQNNDLLKDLKFFFTNIFQKKLEINMEIKTAIILCAGYGKRLNPLTLDKPKPLLDLFNKTLLEHTLNLVEKLNIKKVKLNTFYLPKKIENFFINKNFKLEIDIINDGEKILDTGGGIFNMIKNLR